MWTRRKVSSSELRNSLDQRKELQGYTFVQFEDLHDVAFEPEFEFIATVQTPLWLDTPKIGHKMALVGERLLPYRGRRPRGRQEVASVYAIYRQLSPTELLTQE